MSKFVTIEVDKSTQEGVVRMLQDYGIEATKALMRGLWATALQIESDAKRRLNGQLGSAKHWITGRLASSVHSEARGQNTFKGNKASMQVDTSFGLPIDDLEVVVGTNVNYAPKIEFEYDSFIQFSTNKNAQNLTKNIETQLNKLVQKYNK